MEIIVVISIFQMDTSFIYDIVQTVGQALNTLVTSGTFVQHNYTDCFSFNITDQAAYKNAISLKEQIKKVFHTCTQNV